MAMVSHGTAFITDAVHDELEGIRAPPLKRPPLLAPWPLAPSWQVEVH
jgi:hypothetical protein